VRRHRNPDWSAHSANSGSPAPISGRAMAIDFGGGVDVHFAPFLAWRLAEDYRNAPASTPSSGSHDRFTTGLVFRFSSSGSESHLYLQIQIRSMPMNIQ
jgi:hypothetical protein